MILCLTSYAMPLEHPEPHLAALPSFRREQDRLKEHNILFELSLIGHVHTQNNDPPHPRHNSPKHLVITSPLQPGELRCRSGATHSRDFVVQQPVSLALVILSHSEHNMDLLLLFRKLVLVALWCLGAELFGLLMEELECVFLVDRLALVCRCLEVDGHTTDSSEPAFHVTQTNVEVFSDTVFGDLAGNVHVEEVVLLDVDLQSAHVKLVGCRHVLVKNLGCNAGESGVSNPGTVVTGLDLTKLVGANTGHGLVIGLLVILDGNLGSHPAHGVHSSAVACLDQKLDVGIHEWRSHGDSRTVRQDKVGVLAETLDDFRKSTYLVHLKCCHDGLDQDGTSDGTTGHANVVLSKVEDIVPESGLEMTLHLGKVEVWAGSSLDKLLGVVEECWQLASTCLRMASWVHSSLERVVREMSACDLPFSALTTIFLSVGPVISILRSMRPGAGGAPFHASLSRMCLVSGRNSLRVLLNVRWRRARKTVASLEMTLRLRSLRALSTLFPGENGGRGEDMATGQSRCEYTFRLFGKTFICRSINLIARHHEYRGLEYHFLLLHMPMMPRRRSCDRDSPAPATMPSLHVAIESLSAFGAHPLAFVEYLLYACIEYRFSHGPRILLYREARAMSIDGRVLRPSMHVFTHAHCSVHRRTSSPMTDALIRLDFDRASVKLEFGWFERRDAGFSGQDSATNYSDLISTSYANGLPNKGEVYRLRGSTTPEIYDRRPVHGMLSFVLPRPNFGLCSSFLFTAAQRSMQSNQSNLSAYVDRIRDFAVDRWSILYHLLPEVDVEGQ
ncbi:malate synthase, partial [Aureobasidium sp. EXF-3399]